MTYNFLSPRRKVSFSAWVHLPHLLSPLAPLYLLCFLSLLLSIPIVRSTCYSCSVDYWWLAKGGCFLVRQFSGFERWIGWKWNKADYDCSSMVKQRYVFDGLCDLLCAVWASGMLLEAQDLTCDLLQRSSIRVSFLSSNSFVKKLLASLPLTDDDDDWDTYVHMSIASCTWIEVTPLSL